MARPQIFRVSGKKLSHQLQGCSEPIEMPGAPSQPVHGDSPFSEALWKVDVPRENYSHCNKSSCGEVQSSKSSRLHYQAEQYRQPWENKEVMSQKTGGGSGYP